MQLDCKKDCLMHEWGKEWEQLTSAFVVDVRKVYSAGGASGYLSKYLAKGFAHREELQALGFKRRWSCSRNWPRERQIRLRGTEQGLWDTIEIIPRWFRRKEMEERISINKGADALERVGTDLGEMLRGAIRRRKGVKIIGGLLNENV